MRVEEDKMCSSGRFCGWHNNVAVAASLLSLLILAALPVAARAQAPSPTPVAPGSGGVTFGGVRVLSGNSLARNNGQENQPPVWITIDAKGTSAVVTVGNATRVPLDFNGTVVISLAPDATAAGTAVSTGSAVTQANQVIWSGFSLAAGQIVPAIVVLAGSGPPAAPPATAIQGVTIDARDAQSGTMVSELAAGGGPTLAALAAAPSPVPGQANATRPAAPASVTPLSRDDARHYAGWMLALLLAVLTVVAIATGLNWLTGRRLGEQLSLLTAGSSTVAPPLAESDTRLSQPRGRPAGLEPPTAGWWLEPQDGPEPGRRWSLDVAELGVGRNPRSDIVISDPRVSDRHARLVQQADGSYQLIDEGSTNGTDVNGQRITAPVQLYENDVLRFGSTSFVVQHAAGS